MFCYIFWADMSVWYRLLEQFSYAKSKAAEINDFVYSARG